jgi:acetoin utilization deacetylase AcuC-like enzyme
VGEGEGRGRTLNVPWQQTGLGDADYAAAFEIVLMPVLRAFSEGGRGAFSGGEGDATCGGEGDAICGGEAADDGPTLLLVSAGFDAALGDLQGGMSLSAGGFACLTPTPTPTPNPNPNQKTKPKPNPNPNPN